MLDTVILTIPKGSYRILQPQMFTPNARVLNSSGNYLLKCVSHLTANENKSDKYKPRMTLIKRMTQNGIEIPLKIEFSVTKILYGNNVDEVQEKDFESVIKALTKALSTMGVEVSAKVISEASVAAFHPSKNIELKDGYTSSFVITELNKINVHKKIDLNRDSFRNNGHSLQLYTNSHSLVIYDKAQDIKKPNRRSIDKDQNPLQHSLLEKSEKKQILRIEARFSKRVKMNTVLQGLGFSKNPNFRQVFRKEMCQKVLVYYWNELVTGKNLFLFDVENNPKKTLDTIFRHNPKIKPKDALYLVGLRVLSKEGVRSMRAAIEQYATTRTWYRISEDLKLLDEISDKTYHGWLKQVGDSLERFETYKLTTTLIVKKSKV